MGRDRLRQALLETDRSIAALAGATVSREILRRPSSLRFFPGTVSSIMPASFAAVGSAVLSSEGQYGMVSENLQGKVEKPAARPEMPGLWRYGPDSGTALCSRGQRRQRPRLQSAGRAPRSPHAFLRSNLAGAGAAARNSKRAPGRLSSTVSLKPCKFAIVSAMLRPRPCPGDLPLRSPR
jgi:hypothetical protein